MSLSPNIKVFAGTNKQQAVGIMGRATVYMNSGNDTIASFDQITVRQTKQGKWWIQWPAQEDPRGEKNENGYPKTYPYYRIFPGEENKPKRMQLEKLIIEKTQEAIGSTPQASMSAPTPPESTSHSQPSSDDGLVWDM